MKLTVLKFCRPFYCRRGILPVPNFCWSLSFNRKEHLEVKVSLTSEEMLPNKLSTLYVPGRYGASMYQIVKPVININDIINNIDKIERSCRLRGIELGCEGGNLISLLKEWEILRVKYSEIIIKDQEYLAEQIRLKSLNLTVELENVIKEHNKHINLLKREKEKLHDIEEVVFPLIQKIPNNVHELSPIDSDVVEITSDVSDLEFEAASHTAIGENMSLLEFAQVSPSAYYLTGKLAEIEMAVQAYFHDKFRNSNFSPMSCTDFCKSFIIEAIGLDPYSPDDCIPLKPKHHRDVGQKLNLVGGASFASFCAYLSNMNVNRATLPARYFSLGRCYNARHHQVETATLFSVVQSFNIQCVVLCDAGEEDLEFDACFSELVSIYKLFNVPFRVVVVNAKRLNSTESRRKNIELWCPSSQKYIPVAYLSQRGDFVSKRLHITYGEEHIIQGHCSIIEGTAVNIPVLIGCLMENFQNPNLTFNIQDILKLFI